MQEPGVSHTVASKPVPSADAGPGIIPAKFDR